ncbi:hypothetical protein CLCR_04527 [Cladophialophora carrionii]|uniref:Uncharacterized protein n=1 Tax=Cladophialophora carrionii TaxID=86049 RepID=A0A1C1CLU7_9EURO|nr:hypothetical protein CLCR_04527 [Cladophialophora carrionii]
MYCTYCGKAFRSSEELQEHVSTHPQVRPHKCRICHISFAKRDLLRRHYLIHNKTEDLWGDLTPNAPQTASAAKDKFADRPRSDRITVACVHCAKAKVKCDQKYPCKQCLTKGLTCLSPTSRRHRAAMTRPRPPSPLEEQRDDGSVTTNNTIYLPRPASIMTSPPVTEGGGGRDPNLSQSPEQWQGMALQPAPRDPQLQPINEQPDDVDMSMHLYSNDNHYYVDNNKGQTHSQGSTDESLYPLASKGTWSSQTGVTPKPPSPSSVSGHPTAEGDEENRGALDQEINAAGKAQTSYREPFVNGAGPMMNQENLNMQVQDATVDTLGPQIPESALTDAQRLYQSLFSEADTASNGILPESRWQTPSQLFPTKVNDLQESSPEWAHWWICRCTPLPLSPPAAPADLAMSLLENLAELADEPVPWNSSDEDWRKKHFGTTELFTNIPISEATRECMLVILQRYLRIAMEVHDLDLDSLASPRDDDLQEDDGGTDYLRLPPTKALHIFMDLFLRTFEPYYPLLPGRSLDPNKLVNSSKNKALMLLLLSMLACGSMIDSAPKARRFSTVIGEICRLAMANISFKDPSATASPIFLYCALLSTIKGAFSGVKLHMSVSITHRNVYLMMLKHTGLLKGSVGGDVSQGDPTRDPESAWKCWIERETASRLAYSWVLVDHEISLFYDLPPLLSISELKCRLPVSEKLWLASNPEEWLQGFMNGSSSAGDRSNHSDSLLRRMSLCDIFGLLLNDRLDEAANVLEPLDLRLLLFPLHVLVTDLCQLLDCLPEGRSPFVRLHSVTLRFQEIQQLLRRWLRTFKRVAKHGVRNHAMAQATMILYHVTNLNLFTSVKKIESFARADPSEWTPTTGSVVPSAYVRSPDEALLHCCQVFSLMQEMKGELWPVWSAAAIYRSTLILWMISLASLQGSPLWAKKKLEDRSTSLQKPWENWEANDTSLHETLQYVHDTPYYVFKGGNRVPLDDPAAILQLGLDTMDNGYLTSAFTEGVRSRLQAMTLAWATSHQQLMHERMTCNRQPLHTFGEGGRCTGRRADCYTPR